MQKGLKKYFVNMDEYLSSLGLYRKMVARDASSLFRAVSEQLYYSQNYHQRIRQDCADFMRANRCNFEPFVEGSFEKYLERLEDPKETVGQVEIKALSQLYRRCFLIYRYPGKPATIISMDNFIDKVTLCCSINGHYDIVYPKTYPAAAALCQSLLYELLYLRVFAVDEAELCQASEAFRLGGRRYRNSLSVCSDMDVGYETPEVHSRDELEVGGPAATAEDKHRTVTDDTKHAGEAPPPGGRLTLPYKVLRSLDAEVYRNVEFDVWQDTCKEMQKTEYMVFAGRQYFLGDKCQVRLEPKGKYYNAFIQEVGTHSSAVTVFIEELGEKHLVPLTDLKPVNPVPAWNVAAPTRKGDLDLDSRGQRHHRHRFFRKSRGSSSGGGGMKGAELLITQASSYGGPAPSVLPPRFQPAGHPRPPPPPGAIAYDPYAPPPHHPTARPPRYGAPRSSARFLNRHLIGPQFTYYHHPSRRYCHDYDNYGFRSRRSRRQLATLDKDSQYGFSAEVGEEPPDLDPALSYYQLDDGTEAVFTPLLGQTVTPPPSMGSMPPTSSSSYLVARGSRPLPSAPPPGNTPVCSSDEDQDASTVEDQADFADDYIYMSQDQGYPTPGVYAAASPTAEPSSNQNEPEGDSAHSPKRADMSFSYSQQVVKPLAVICSSPSSSSSPSSPSSHVATAAAHHPPSTHTQSRSVAMAVSAASSSWLVSELAEPLSMAPPPYSYDPNGGDLPRDCRVLQYYFNLGVQWYHQSCWQQQQVYPPPPPTENPYAYQHYSPYLAQEPPLHAPPSYPETGRTPHQPPSFPEGSRAEVPTEGPSSGATSSMESSSPLSPAPTGGAPPPPVLLYSEQPAPPPLIHLPYEAPPPPAYLPAGPPPPPHSLSHPGHAHSALLPHHSYVPCLPSSTHWGALQTGHTPRVYCPTSNPPHHVVSYIPAPLHHATATHYIPPTM